MTEALAAAQEQVREIVRELKALSCRLQEVHSSVPASPEELNLRDLEEMEPVTDLRTAIEGVLRDAIQPAIEDLERRVQPESEPAGTKGAGR
jgi:hypothetical protein